MARYAWSVPRVFIERCIREVLPYQYPGGGVPFAPGCVSCPVGQNRAVFTESLIDGRVVVSGRLPRPTMLPRVPTDRRRLHTRAEQVRVWLPDVSLAVFCELF